jgi:hypothetical protein
VTDIFPFRQGIFLAMRIKITIGAFLHTPGNMNVQR